GVREIGQRGELPQREPGELALGANEFAEHAELGFPALLERARRHSWTVLVLLGDRRAGRAGPAGALRGGACGLLRLLDGRRGRGKQVPRELTLHVEELLGEIEDVVDDLVRTRDVACAVVPGRERRGLV